MNRSSAPCFGSQRFCLASSVDFNRQSRYPADGIVDQAAINKNEYQVATYSVVPSGSMVLKKKKLQDLGNTINIDPSSMIIRLKELIKTYPKVPQLYNYLSVAYSRLGNHEEAEKIVVENYKRNTNYLFAKLNYAEICIQKGEYEIVPEILDGKFDIKALYPNRGIFHITEVVGYWGIAGLYFVGIGKNDAAKIFYDNLKKLVPDHPYTKKLKQHFLVSSIKESFNKCIFPSRRRK